MEEDAKETEEIRDNEIAERERREEEIDRIEAEREAFIKRDEQLRADLELQDNILSTFRQDPEPYYYEPPPPPPEPLQKRRRRRQPRGTDIEVDGVRIQVIPERHYTDRKQFERWACVCPNPDHLEVLACNKSRATHLDVDRLGLQATELVFQCWIAAAWTMEAFVHFAFTPHMLIFWNTWITNDDTNVYCCDGR